MKSKQHSRRRIVVNIFGTLGYLSVFLQWTWTAIILLYPLFQSEAVQKIFLPERQAPRPVVSHSGCYSDAAPFIAIVSIAITAAIINRITKENRQDWRQNHALSSQCDSRQYPLAKTTTSKKMEIKLIVQTDNLH